MASRELVLAIVRLVTLVYMDVDDMTWDYFSPIVWSTCEQSIGIICVCLPTLGPLRLHFRAMTRETVDSESTHELSVTGK